MFIRLIGTKKNRFKYSLKKSLQISSPNSYLSSIFSFSRIFMHSFKSSRGVGVEIVERDNMSDLTEKLIYIYVIK
jgi:hypothetical protein